MNYKNVVLSALLFATQAGGELVETKPRVITRSLPDEPVFTNDTAYKKKYEEIVGQVQSLEKEVTDAKRKLVEARGRDVPATEPQNDTGAQIEGETAPQGMKSRAAGFVERRSYTNISPQQGYSQGFATDSMSFSGGLSETNETTAVLPVGAFVSAIAMSGVESVANEPYPVLLKLRGEYVGPNNTRIDLSSCFMIAKARANLSTERVLMETDTLSCVKENGEVFKAQARGYTTGTDNAFGSTGKLISKQGQVMLAAVLASIAKNAGSAIAAAQQTTSVAGSDKAATATNVTGNKALFVAGSSVVDGATLIAQWYLDFARSLVPSIALGSGAPVTVVMLEPVKIPRLNSNLADDYPWANQLGAN